MTFNVVCKLDSFCQLFSSSFLHLFNDSIWVWLLPHVELSEEEGGGALIAKNSRTAWKLAGSTELEWVWYGFAGVPFLDQRSCVLWAFFVRLD